MKSTVIITHYKYESYIKYCLRSLVDQLRKPDQVILVNDEPQASKELLDIIGLFTDYLRIDLVCKENHGQLEALRAGIKVAIGNIIYFLDADDVYNASHISKTLALYESDSCIDSVLNLCEAIDENGLPIEGVDVGQWMQSKWESSISDSRFLGTYLQTDFIQASCISAKKDFLIRVLGPDFINSDYWRIRADDIIHIGLRILGAVVIQLPDVLTYYRIHSSNGYAGKQQSKYEEQKRIQVLDDSINGYLALRGFTQDRVARYLSSECSWSVASENVRRHLILENSTSSLIGLYRLKSLVSRLLSRILM